MSTRKLVLSGLSLSALVAACTGLDPGAFQSKRSPASDPEVAGWSFDAGSSPDGGRAGSGVTSQGGSGGRASADPGADSEDGGAGESGDGGAAGDAGVGSGGRGGSGGSGGARAGNGGLGGNRVVGGSGGRASGGAGNGSGAGGLAAAGQAGAPAAHEFYFSEYVEGSSSYKALEITARKASSFAGCRLVTYFNGASSGSGIALDGSLPAGDTYVLCSTALSTLLGETCQRATNLTFNGDDALALECDGAALDVIGQIGVDPGDAWEGGEASTLNRTLRRNCAAVVGDPTGSEPFEPALEWAAFPVDTFDGLGSNECSEPTTP